MSQDKCIRLMITNKFIKRNSFKGQQAIISNPKPQELPSSYYKCSLLFHDLIQLINIT